MRASARVLSPASSSAEPLPAPGPSDWLAVHPEPAQTFEDFVRSRPNRPCAGRDRIYLVPFGRMAADRSPSLAELAEFARAFFGLPVVVLDAKPLGVRLVRSRRNARSGHEQLLAGDLLELLRRELRADAFCLLGITMTDLYPDESWDFVFGQASLSERIGVMSFARYDPRFYGGDWDERARRRMFERSAKVLAHEVGHMFGIRHCVLHRCLMNGSNHLAESDARPLHLCPVDADKLGWSLGTDPSTRYPVLAALWRRHARPDEARWLEARAQLPLAR